jgi:ferric-dicitrate binding protein FerR (iron transport regulator)
MTDSGPVELPFTENSILEKVQRMINDSNTALKRDELVVHNKPLKQFVTELKEASDTALEECKS